MTNKQKNLIAQGIIEQLKKLVEIAATDDKISKDVREHLQNELELIEGSIDAYRELVE